MYISTAVHRPRLEAGREEVVRRMGRSTPSGLDAYRIHQHIWDLFADSPDRDRDFLFRQTEINSRTGFYLVSHRQPRDATGSWRLAIKDYHPRLRSGQELVFALRANPVISRREEGPHGKSRVKRHSVVADFRQNLPPGERPSGAEVVQRAGLAWLTARAEKNGFQPLPDQVRADCHRDHILYKGRRRISLASIDFHGRLRVTDAEAFSRALFSGIGPAKGFGFGLLLVRGG